jgi:2-hydroxy-3-keto-5-methylthiopentenyl-1-phosphate phosphatase
MIKLKSNDKMYVYKVIRNELLEIDNDISHVVDTLVKYLYGKKRSSFKTTLWESFGDVLTQNITHNLNGTKPCLDCGDTVEKVKAKKYCESCAAKRERERVRNLRKMKKMNENKTTCILNELSENH